MHLPSKNNQPELHMDENSCGKAKDCSEEAPRVPRRSLTEGEHGATCRSYFTPRHPFPGPEHLRTRRASLGTRGIAPHKEEDNPADGAACSPPQAGAITEERALPSGARVTTVPSSRGLGCLELCHLQEPELSLGSGL